MKIVLLQIGIFNDFKKYNIPYFVEIPWVKKNGLFDEAGINGEPLLDDTTITFQSSIFVINQ